MAKRRKKKKNRSVDEGDSNAKLFVARHMEHYGKGLLTNSELESKILDLIVKCNVAEVMQYLPVELVAFLKEIASREEDEEHFFVLEGCFGLELDCEKYISDQKKDFNKASKRLKEFYKRVKK